MYFLYCDNIHFLSKLWGPAQNIGTPGYRVPVNVQPWNSWSQVRSRAATYQTLKMILSCSSHGSQNYRVELGMVDPVSGWGMTGCGFMSSVWGMMLQ